MSYPKGGKIIRTKEEQRDERLNMKKEQLKKILINKFRSKYGVRAEFDEFDQVIKDQVSSFLDKGAMTE